MELRVVDALPLSNLLNEIVQFLMLVTISNHASQEPMSAATHAQSVNNVNLTIFPLYEGQT